MFLNLFRKGIKSDVRIGGYVVDKRNDFLNSNSRFFDNGFVREIYGNENVSIMNVCERLLKKQVQY